MTTTPQPFGFCANCYTVAAFEPAVCLVAGTGLCGACTKTAFSSSLSQTVIALLAKISRQPGTNQPK